MFSAKFHTNGNPELHCYSSSCTIPIAQTSTHLKKCGDLGKVEWLYHLAERLASNAMEEEYRNVPLEFGDGSRSESTLAGRSAVCWACSHSSTHLLQLLLASISGFGFMRLMDITWISLFPVKCLVYISSKVKMDICNGIGKHGYMLS